MIGMKGDMAGAACVVGLMHALAARKAKDFAESDRLRDALRFDRARVQTGKISRHNLLGFNNATNAATLQKLLISTPEPT